MKFGEDIKKGMEKTILSMRTYTRLRHFRGHGIHSPFVYALIRNVFMKRNLPDNDKSELFAKLCSCGVAKYYARQLQNLYNFCEYNSYHIEGYSESKFNTKIGNTDLFSGFRTSEDVLYFIMADSANYTLRRILEKKDYFNFTLVILSPHLNRARQRICEGMIAGAECMSIDNRGYTIFFYNRRLPVQHFKL